MVRDDLSFRVDDELCEVPRDNLGLALGAIPERAVQAKELVNGMRLRSVNIDLGEHGESSTICSLSKLLDLCISSRFLFAELIAGECEDLEAATL